MFLSKGRCMSGTPEALSRVNIDVLLWDAGQAFAKEMRSASNLRCRTVHRAIAYSSTGAGQSVAMFEAECFSTNPMP